MTGLCGWLRKSDSHVPQVLALAQVAVEHGVRVRVRQEMLRPSTL